MKLIKTLDGAILIAVVALFAFLPQFSCLKQIKQKPAKYELMCGLMHTTLLTDVNDRECFQKLDALYQYGNIDFMSTVVQVVRPKFNVVTPYKKMPNGKYDLTQWSPEFFRHLDKVLKWCESHPANTPCGHVILQIDMYNDPTARNDNMLPAYSGDNIQGYRGNFPNDIRKVPTGAWAEICTQLIKKMVPYINRGGAVLWVLEGAGSAPFEQWCWDVAKTNGLSQSVYVITNSNLPGAVKSPHVKSVASVKSGAHAGYYGSSDGWQGDSPSKYNQCLSICYSKRAAAFETWANGTISGGYNVSKEQRVRPTLVQLSQGQFAQFILTMGKY